MKTLLYIIAFLFEILILVWLKIGKDIDLLHFLYYNYCMLDNSILSKIKKFDKLALAISGGKDSMSLLFYFCQNIDKSKFFVITVHHNLRGDEGRRDRDFVIDYCKKHGVECMAFEEDIPSFCSQNGFSVEQGARIRRRQIFSDIVAEHKAQRVVTAHHSSDQVESILMHIFRGSGIRGLCGMSFDDGLLLRPLLYTDKKVIDEYVEANKIPYVEDSTNFCVDYTRNKLRREIIPLIKEAYGGLDKNILRLSQRAKEIFDFIDNQSQCYKIDKKEVFIPSEVLEGEKVIAQHTIINAVDKISTRVDLTVKHIDAIIALNKKLTGASIDLPFGLKAYKDDKGVVLSKISESKLEGKIEGYGRYVLGDKVLVLSKDKTNLSKLKCDIDKLDGAVIRNRKDGDIFKRYKGATKSLGDYFTDSKIAKRLRDNVIVIAKDNNVLLLPEYEISDYVKVDENTKNIAYINVESITDTL